ncbi:hypothetical protein ACS0TY_002424 [Phlomoides rotata]
MVSVYPNAPPDQDLAQYYGFHMAGDPMRMPGTNRSDRNLIQTAPVDNASSGLDDPNKKIRKPYTISKSRESWSEQEHDKFLEALQLFDRDWKKIEAFVGSKTVIQIRSHAQKYFLKVQKNGTSEHVPPPRPKRKAAHPYPQKASKNPVSQTTGPLQSSAAPIETGYTARPDSLSMPKNPVNNAPLPSWSYNVVSTGCLQHVSNDDIGLANVTNNYSCSSNESTPRVRTSNGANREVKVEQCSATRVMPDFARVYGFIGSVFDPAASDHLQRLRKLDPINVETILMMMKNLCVNLVSPEFEGHRRLLSTYKSGIENDSFVTEIPPA